MSIPDQRGNIKKEHLSFFLRLRTIMTIPFHSSLPLSHFTKHARINVSIWTTKHLPLHGLTQQQSTSNKLGLMLGQGKGTFAVAHWSARFQYRRSKQYAVATRQVFCSSLSKYPTVTSAPPEVSSSPHRESSISIPFVMPNVYHTILIYSNIVYIPYHVLSRLAWLTTWSVNPAAKKKRGKYNLGNV